MSMRTDGMDANIIYQLVVYLYFRDLPHMKGAFDPNASMNFELMKSQYIETNSIEFCNNLMNLNFSVTVKITQKDNCMLVKRAMRPKMGKRKLQHTRSEYERLERSLNITAW